MTTTHVVGLLLALVVWAISWIVAESDEQFEHVDVQVYTPGPPDTEPILPIPNYPEDDIFAPRGARKE